MVGNGSHNNIKGEVRRERCCHLGGGWSIKKFKHTIDNALVGTTFERNMVDVFVVSDHRKKFVLFIWFSGMEEFLEIQLLSFQIRVLFHYLLQFDTSASPKS